MEVSGQLHVSASILRGKITWYLLNRGWADTGVDLDTVE
jgi:hypothetical protein